MKTLCLILLAALPQQLRAGDTIDLLYMGEKAPLILRLSVKVDGNNLQQTWREYVDALFARLDNDNDNELSQSEVAGAPTPIELVRNGLAESDEDGLPDVDLFTDKQVSKQELHAYFKMLGATGFSSRIVKRRESADLIDSVTGQPLSSGFFELIDRNQDQLLTSDELKRAYFALRKFDENDDESISTRELGMAFSIEQIQRLPALPPEPAKPRFIRLQSNTNKTTAEALLARYDANRDKTLDRSEAWFSKQAFGRHDTNNDMVLGSSELEPFLQSPRPQVHITANVHSKGPGQVKIALSKQATSGNVKQWSRDTSILRLSVSQIDVIVRQQPPAKDNVARYKAIFASADEDKNGYLNVDESRRFRNFRSTFAGMDRDRDEKVYEPELIAYALNETALANAHTTLVVTEQGRDLIEILDLNRDSQISRREMIGAIDRLKRWDKNSDGKIARTEVPRQFMLSIGRSPAQLLFNRLPRVNRQSPAGQAKAPTWFLRMDRNQDGDLSRREFLGTAAKFRQFDKNDDGLISPAEAR